MCREHDEPILDDEEQNESEFENSEPEPLLKFDPSDNHPQPQPDRVSTGPRTPEGKAISSQNAVRHGLRSSKLVLRNENPDEYETLFDEWWESYKPKDHVEEELVTNLINSHWFLKRAARRLEDVDWEMPVNAYTWTKTHHREFGLFTRYKTAAERVFHKAFREVNMYLKDAVKGEVTAFRAETMRMKVEAEIARKAPPAAQPTIAETAQPAPETASPTDQTKPQDSLNDPRSAPSGRIDSNRPSQSLARMFVRDVEKTSSLFPRNSDVSDAA